MAKITKELKGDLEDQLERPLTKLETEILGLLQNHTEHIAGLSKRVQALEDSVKVLLNSSIKLVQH